MKLLFSKKKLFRLSFGVIFAMVVFAVYMIYKDVFIPQPAEFKGHGIYDSAPEYQLYGPNYREREKGGNLPLHITQELAEGNVRNENSEEESYDFDQRRDDDRFDEAFVAKPLLEEPAYLVGVYKDEEMFKKMKDFQNMDGIVDNPLLGTDQIGLGGRGHYEEEFQYPEVGYRYQNALNVPHTELHSTPNPIANVKAMYRGHIIPTLKSNVPVSHVKNMNVKKKVVKPKSRPKLKAKSQKQRPLNVFPPPPVSMPVKSAEEIKYLVYLCDTSHLCGGWGDRQRGMLATYFLARLSGRQMKIIMNTPCNLTYFYVPHKVQWLSNMTELRSTSNITINAFLKTHFKDSLMSNDFNTMYPQKVVYLKTNQDYYARLQKNPYYSQLISQWSALKNKETRFQWAWNDLFQPSGMLLTHAEQKVGQGLLMRKGLIPRNTARLPPTDSIYNVGDSTLICAHARVGKNPTIPMDNYFNSFDISDVPILHNFMLSLDVHKDALFFVASDSSQIRLLSHKFFGDRFINYGGKILHIDRQRSEQNACVGFEAALMDQLILSLCDYLVVSRSGFSIHASYMGNITQPVYILEDGDLKEFHI